MEEKNTHKRQLEGVVISNKMTKTVVVKVDRITRDPKYQKRITSSNRFKAHDEKNECMVGEHVIIEECRPLSKEKRWIVIKKKQVT